MGDSTITSFRPLDALAARGARAAGRAVFAAAAFATSTPVPRVPTARIAGPTAGTWEDIPPCTDILISWGKLRIIGLAWDNLIDDAWPQTAPNDNFASYGLSYQKQFSPSASAIPITATADHPSLAPTVRVPDTLAIVPTAADADLLAEWDLTTVDEGSQAPGGGQV